MLLRPPRLVPREDKAETYHVGVALENVEHLVGSILEAPDPWRPLDDVRRKLSPGAAVCRTRGNESSTGTGNCTLHDTV